MDQLTSQTLYNYGARKVAVHGLGLVGCTPYEMSRHSLNDSCVEYINTTVQLFNLNLKLLVDEFNSNTSLEDAKFTYLNLYDMSMEVIKQPSAFGNNHHTHYPISLKPRFIMKKLHLTLSLSTTETKTITSIYKGKFDEKCFL